MNIVTNLPSRFDTVKSNSEFGEITDYEEICHSLEMEHLMSNTISISTHSFAFIKEFERISDSKVYSLDKLLLYAMTVLPASFIVIFSVALIIIAKTVDKESLFRMTLYLSIPEQIAFDNFRSSGIAQNVDSTLNVANASKSISPIKSGNQLSLLKNPTNVNLLASPKQSSGSNPNAEDVIREKAMEVESLYRFSRVSSGFSGTGLFHYSLWMIIFYIVGAISMPVLALFSRSINSTFHGRSMMMCAAELRYSCLLYSAINMEENFHCLDPDIFEDQKDLSNTTEYFYNITINLQNTLTYGKEYIDFDYREYESVQKMMDGNQDLPEYPGLGSPTAANIDHGAYNKLGLGLMIILMTDSIKGFQKNFDLDQNKYKLESDEWNQYNHLLINHMIDNLSSIYHYYLDGINGVINNSFIIALVVSIITVIIMLILTIYPIRLSLDMLVKYFSLTVQLLAQVHPEVFMRTIYIKKWLIREITRSNYAQFEGTFKRNISQELQSGILNEADEKMIIFDLKGNLFDTFSLDSQKIQDKSVRGIMSMIIDTSSDKVILETITRAFNRYVEAKDKTDNTIIAAKDIEGNPVRVTITGIASVDSSIIITTSHSFYSHIGILIKKIGEVTAIREKLEEQKASTIEIMKAVLPQSFAEKLQDGSTKAEVSAGIGSILIVELCDFHKKIGEVKTSETSKFLLNCRNAVDELLKSFDNLTHIGSRNGKFKFIAGLFNDEQNGRTEAADSLRFAHRLNSEISKICRDAGIPIDLKYGLSTGGPIYCKVIVEGVPVFITTGEPELIAQMLSDRAKPAELLMDRTSFECLSEIEVEATEVELLDTYMKRINVWSHNIESEVNENIIISTNTEPI